MHRIPRLFLRFLALLPLRALHALGTLFGWVVYGMSPTYRRNLRANLAQAGFADARIRHCAIAHAGRMVLETPAIWLRPHERVARLVREVDGLDAALAVQERGGPLLFLAPHMGCFEIAPHYVSRRVRLTILYRPPKMRWLEPLMLEGRGRPNIRLAPADLRGVREVFTALKRGEAVGFLPDQVPGAGEGDWAEFFGRPAYTATLAPKLAAREDVSCFLVYAMRLPRARGYRLVMRPLIPALAGESPLRHMNRALEELVRECPEQYLWGYNRYKTPSGARPRPA